MRPPDSYRYLLASRPDPARRRELVALRRPAGQAARPVPAGLLHMTWCVLAETGRRDPFLLPRVRAALAGATLASGSLWLGRVRGGAGGAAVCGRGPKPELIALYRSIVAALATRGLQPLHRQSGFRPHVTLGHAPCAFAPFRLLHLWVPDELLLIESEVGNTVHNVLARWPLRPPLQAVLPFEAPVRPRAVATT